MKKLMIDRRVRADEPRKDGRCFREAAFEVEMRDGGDGKSVPVVRASVSSETPYRRTMWDPEDNCFRDGYEVLGHADGEIDASRMRDGLVIQDTHWGDQIGIIRKPEIKDGKIVGEIEFGCSDRAQVIARDAAAGIRRNMSVGYIVNEYKKAGKAEDGLPIFRVTSWTPYEASFVNVPADTGVGVDRDGHLQDRKPTTAPAVGERQSTMKLTAEQRQKIRELASAAHVSGEEVADILTSERSFEEIREELLNRREKYLAELAKKPAKPATESRAVIDEGDKAKIRKRYDFIKVLRYLADVAKGERPDVDIGFEREVSDELAMKTGRAVQGILLPDFVRAAANSADGALTLGTPAYDTDTGSGGISGIGGAGKNLIQTMLLSGQFIDALVATLVLREQLGAEVLTGLVGNIAIPKGGSITGGWVSEGSNAAKKNPTFGQIVATPHTYGAYVDITRKLLLQSSINVQAKVLEWLMYACANGLETAAFNGSGTSGQPKGLCTALNSAATAWSNEPTFDKLVNLIAGTKTANSYRPTMRFVGNANVWSKLAKTRDYEVLTDGASDSPKNVSAIGGSTRLLDVVTNKVIGRDFVEANLMPDGKLLFGDFSQLAVCLWSGTDIIVDPYANDTNGGLRLVALQDSDILIKRTESFALATGVHS